MSGAEVVALLGVISSVMSIVQICVQTCHDVCQAARDVNGLPDKLRSTAEYLPNAVLLLDLFKTGQENEQARYERENDPNERQAIIERSKFVEGLMVQCKGQAIALRIVLQRLAPVNNESRYRRYLRAGRAVLPGQLRKVEELRKQIQEKLDCIKDLTHTMSLLRIEKKSGPVWDAVLARNPFNDPLNAKRQIQSGSESAPSDTPTGTKIQNLQQRIINGHSFVAIDNSGVGGVVMIGSQQNHYN